MFTTYETWEATGDRQQNSLTTTDHYFLNQGWFCYSYGTTSKDYIQQQAGYMLTQCTQLRGQNSWLELSFSTNYLGEVAAVSKGKERDIFSLFHWSARISAICLPLGGLYF